MSYGRLTRRYPFTKNWKLDKLNERLADEGRHLHPTKGLRDISVARSKASIITEQMKSGQGWWPMKRIQMEIKKALSDDADIRHRRPAWAV
jgi:hypothetical protein